MLKLESIQILLLVIDFIDKAVSILSNQLQKGTKSVTKIPPVNRDIKKA